MFDQAISTLLILFLCDVQGDAPVAHTSAQQIVQGALLAQVSYINRLLTQGAAPADGCTDASQVNATILVNYEADYYFFQR